MSGLPQHSSESAEWYTPHRVLELARETLGGFDLDPASTATVNRERVRAGAFFTREDDGLSREWFGRVWLNPPYGRGEGNRSNQDIWTAKLVDEYRAGRVEAGIVLVNAAIGTSWFARLWDFPICFPDRRLRFESPGGGKTAPPNGNALVYFGPNPTRFAEVFAPIGAIVERFEVAA